MRVLSVVPSIWAMVNSISHMPGSVSWSGMAIWPFSLKNWPIAVVMSM